MKVLQMKKLALALGSLAVLGFASQASAVGVFYVNPNAPGVQNTTTSNSKDPLSQAFHADGIAGTSSELLTNGPSGSSGSGYLDFLNFTTLETGNDVGALTTGLGLGTATPTKPSLGYGLYLTFQLSVSGALGGPQSVQTLNFQVFLDPSNNDVFTGATVNQGANTATGTSISNRSDDILIGFGSTNAGSGSGVINSGGVALNTLSNFAICTGASTAASGKTVVPGTVSDGTATYSCAASPTGLNATTGFFTGPSPFYQLAFSAFNNTADKATSTQSGNYTAIAGATGSVSFIPVPEPGTIALFGIAAVAMGVSSRRRNRK